MIFTIQNLGFAIGDFLLEGWLAFAARCACALVLLALGAVMILPVLILFFVMQKYFIQGMVDSAVK